MKRRSSLWLAVLPAVLAVGFLARPASAHVLVDLGVSPKQEAKFEKQVKVSPGQLFFFRMVAVNVSVVPLIAVCDIPGLKVNLAGVLLPFSVREVLLPKRPSGMIIAALCPQPGTFKTTVFVRFLDPFTGRVREVHDTVVVVCELADGKKKAKDTGAVGKKDPAAGAQQGGAAGSQQAVGQLGASAQQTGAAGAQQTGG